MDGTARDLGACVAGVQTLGADFVVDAATRAGALGYGSVWVAEANASEAMSLLGAVSVAAPSVDLGTGVLALQLRTPPLTAMGAATLAQLAPDRDVLLGVGISAPAVVGRWHGATYGDRPLAQVREYVALVRECLSGETVTFEGDFWTVRKFRLGMRPPERPVRIVVGALNPGMLRLGGEVADGVLLNYLPAHHVPWSVEQIRAGGEARIYAYVHCAVTDRERYAEHARRDLFGYAVVDSYASNFTRAGYGDDVAALREAFDRRDRDAALAAISDTWVDEVQIMGDAAHVGDAVAAYRAQGVDVPIVFPLPWGEDRRAVVAETLRAAVSR